MQNQAWVPKIIVIFGLSLAVFTVLLYPLDIANVKACTAGLSPSACTFTLPTYQIWLACFISILVMSFAIIPFAVFYYEADSEFTQFQKVKTAVVWTLGLIAILTLIIGILYFLVGYVVWNVQLLSSGTFPLSAVYDGSYSQANYPYPCIMTPISPPIQMPFPPAPPPGSPPPSPPPPPPAMQGSNITLACIANLPNNLLPLPLPVPVPLPLPLPSPAPSHNLPDLMRALEAEGDLTTFISAINLLKLTPLVQAGYTILAPNDQAFIPLFNAAAKNGTSINLTTGAGLNPLVQGILSGIANLHLIKPPSRINPVGYSSAALTLGLVLQTLGQSTLLVGRDGTGLVRLTVNSNPSSQASIIKSDIQVQNKIIIHKTNSVLSNIQL